MLRTAAVAIQRDGDVTLDHRAPLQTMHIRPAGFGAAFDVYAAQSLRGILVLYMNWSWLTMRLPFIGSHRVA